MRVAGYKPEYENPCLFGVGTSSLSIAETLTRDRSVDSYPQVRKKKAESKQGQCMERKKPPSVSTRRRRLL